MERSQKWKGLNTVGPCTVHSQRVLCQSNQWLCRYIISFLIKKKSKFSLYLKLPSIEPQQSITSFLKPAIFQIVSFLWLFIFPPFFFSSCCCFYFLPHVPLLPVNNSIHPSTTFFAVWQCTFSTGTANGFVNMSCMVIYSHHSSY